MNNTRCPRCNSNIEDTVLYQCVRCFTIYCKFCPDTKEGHICPKCGMSQRLVVSPDRK